ncbi:hypothetical protein [Streptomyces griseus]|uniref:hypothetical protein n=1 Tax=Streptomyces griseus TaxID=1911 RepID=UPI00055FEFE7|nr:hypothetical protein [Streptomyces griseus]
MDGFSDQLMIQYLDPARVHSLLVPPDDPEKNRLKSLLASVYQPNTLEVRVLDKVRIVSTRFQAPVKAPVAVRGSWEKLLPDIAQARAVVEIPGVGPPLWIDVALDTEVTARVALTEGALDSLASEDLTGLSPEEFVARFSFLDLAELMRRSKVADYQELQAEFPRLYRLHFANPPPYDPSAPGRIYRLRVSVLIFPGLDDLVGVMRRLVQSRQALDETRPCPDVYDGGVLLAAGAWLAVFPASALPDLDPTGMRQRVNDLLATDGFVTAFETNS